MNVSRVADRIGIVPGPMAGIEFSSRTHRRLLVCVALLGAAMFPGRLGELTRGLVVDAYLGVSVLVASTLLIFYGAEKLFKFNFDILLRDSSKFAVPIAALLGATPGCGGAVLVVAAYSSGKASFGAVLAALTATMGDAAFLLIAKRPDAALVVLPLSFLVGVVSGWIVDHFRFWGIVAKQVSHGESGAVVGKTRSVDFLFLALAAPGLAFGVLSLLQVDVPEPYAMISTYVALAGTAVGLLIWTTSGKSPFYDKKDSAITRMAEETSFISVWVIGAFLGYDYLVEFAGLNLEYLFSFAAPILPLAAILVGFVPGCGPQILVTSLYVTGVIPFAAIIGNAISNDGDALFPAIALNPKAAMLATVYSAVPALIVAYSFHFLAPSFLN